MRAIRGAYRQVIGIPDYERYAEHMALHHPGAPLLSRRAFFAQAIDRKYGRGKQRCC
ncbi:MAG: YbdD/YjiX family protein [Paraburkholderia sp.]|nr:MAG: YbdD/YjiX family protein [Paraburkholderia sp.]